jgi:hypothetical protein
MIFIALGQINSIPYKGYELQVRRYKENDGGANGDDPFTRLLPMTEFISVRYVPILEMASRVLDYATTLFMPSPLCRIRFGTMSSLKGILEEWKDLYYDKKYGKVTTPDTLSHNVGVYDVLSRDSLLQSALFIVIYWNVSLIHLTIYA